MPARGLHEHSRKIGRGGNASRTSTPSGGAEPDWLLYEAVIAHADEGICVCHAIEKAPFVRFTVWNRRMTELTGYSMQDINRRGWYQTMYPDPAVQAAAAERMSRMRQGEDLRHEEWEVIRADGARRIFGISTCVVPGGDATAHVMALMSDVTDRRRAEAELAHRDAILAAVAFSSECFLRSASAGDGFEELLRRLGEAVRASRAYLCANEQNQNGTLVPTQRCAWLAPGIECRSGTDGLQGVALHTAGLGRWAQLLKRGETVYGRVGDFPAAEKVFLEQQDIRSLLVAPVFCCDRWWGFLGFDDCREERSWSAAERDALRTAADLLGAALQRQADQRTLDIVHGELEHRVRQRTSELSRANQALRQEIRRRRQAEQTLRTMALTDELTGIYNRRGLFEVGEAVLRLARRERRRTALVFADTDGLKGINDSFGHAEGDRALLDTTRVLSRAFRDADVIARIGGDEFVVLMVVDSRADTERIVTVRIEEQLRAINAEANREYPLSISLGVLLCSGDACGKLERLLEQSDQLMYEAKKRRRGPPHDQAKG